MKTTIAKEQIKGLVSVIIPNYCHAPYLEERIESVLKQSYPHFEIILLDDHSTDNSREILERYRTDPHVSAIHYNRHNSGSTFRQWQRGFNLARGEFIWIAESDDYANPHFLERCIEPLLHNPRCVMAYSESQIVDAHSRPFRERVPHAVVRHRPCDVWQGEEFVRRNMLLSNAVYNASMVLFRHSALPLESSYASFRLNGDWLFWCEVALQGEVAHLTSPYNYFRRIEGSVTLASRRSGLAHREMLRLGELLIKRLSLPRHTRLALEGRLSGLRARIQALEPSNGKEKNSHSLDWKRLWYKIYQWGRLAPRIG